MHGDCGGPHVDGAAENAFHETWVNGDYLCGVVNGNSGRPTALTQSRLQGSQDGKVHTGNLQIPLIGKSPTHPLVIGQRIVHVGLLDLDIMQADNRIDFDGSVVGFLANDLAVQLAFGRDINHNVIEKLRLARQPPSGAEATFLPVSGFCWTALRDMIRSAGHVVLGEDAIADLDLASAADRTPAANTVDVDTKRPRALQNWCADRELSAFSRWHEDGQRGFGVFGFVHTRLPMLDQDAAADRLRPPRRRPPAPASPCPTGRFALSQVAQFGSCPINTSAAFTLNISSE